ncbi:MAG: N-acetylmuramoyl-L-alanine amidase [bacterium]
MKNACIRNSCHILILVAWLLLCTPASADLHGWVIGIDPGHGGTDPGAVGPTGLQEKAVNLTTSLGARAFLVRQNATVYMTRTDDATLSLSYRANFMNSLDVDRSICVHHNASGSPDPNWHLTYVAGGDAWATSGNLADDVTHRVTDWNGLGFGWSNCGREGVYEENFYMLVYTTMPAILPEISFISNPEEELRLYQNRYCYGNGRGIFYGLMDHLGGWDMVSSTSDPDQLLIPSEFGVSQNYPNPFNAETVIPLELPQRSRLRLDLFNVQGRNLGRVFEGIKNAGKAEIRYNASTLASGVYFYRITAEGLERDGSYSDVGKMVLLK